MTNNHVVAGAERICVVLSPAVAEISVDHTNLRRQQLTYPAQLIGTSPRVDLALIKIDAQTCRPFNAPRTCGSTRVSPVGKEPAA